MATIKDVAERAGVSYTTVSHVINKTRPVSAEAIHKVKLAITELNYRPNRIARSLRKQESRMIGVINLVNSDPYFVEVLDGMEKEAYLAGYSVIASHTRGDFGKERENIEMMIEKGVDGLLVYGLQNEDLATDLLSTAGIPVITLHLEPMDLPIDFYTTKDFEGAYNAVKHLIDLGHKKIACIAGPTREMASPFQRRFGWEKALKDHGITVPPEYLQTISYSAKGGILGLNNLLALPEPPTAVFCYCDMIAIGVLRAAADKGMIVPDDLSVVGFDNLRMTQYTIPRLTTIRQPKFRCGQELFQRMLSRLNNPEENPPHHFAQETELIIRESTAPPK